MADTIWFAGDPAYGASGGTKYTYDGGEWDYPDPDVLDHYGTFPDMGSVAGLNVDPGMHQVYVQGFSPNYGPIVTGEFLFGYVYISATNTPQQLALRFRNQSAVWAGGYWGTNLWTPSNHYYMGAMPSTGTWHRLTIPLSTLTAFSSGDDFDGFSFTCYDGQAWFDLIGVATAAAEPNSNPEVTLQDTLVVGTPATSDPEVSMMNVSAITNAPAGSDPEVSMMNVAVIASWDAVVAPGTPAEYNVSSLIY